jgi:hypothetical protein
LAAAIPRPPEWGYGLRPWQQVGCVQVPADLYRDRASGTRLANRVLEQALAHLLDDHDVVLVHGRVHERGRLWPMPGAEIGRRVIYDPPAR